MRASTKSVVIDVDTGADDAIALVMAVNSPELDILGVTTVAGNARLHDTTRNTIRLLDRLGRPDIPTSVGADRPLSGRFDYAYHYHGTGGLTTSLPATDSVPVSARAVEFIQDQASARPGDVTLIALGPLTNVAEAIRKEPRLRDWLREIVVMGGAVEVPGNVTPFAEFNIHSDPRAANVVLSSGIPITLVGLDVGNSVAFGRTDTDWRSAASIGGELVSRIVEGWFDLHPDRGRCVLCDPITVAAAIRPDLFDYRQATVTVDELGPERGRTRADYGPGNVSVALDVDVERTHRFVLDRLKPAHSP